MPRVRTAAGDELVLLGELIGDDVETWEHLEVCESCAGTADPSREDAHARDCDGTGRVDVLRFTRNGRSWDLVIREADV